MSIATIPRIKPRNDNVLVQMDMHANAQSPEEQTAGGILIPKIAERGHNNRECVPATVVAAGPGHYHEKWQNAEAGMSPDGRSTFVAMNPDIRPGVRVLVDSPNAGDRMYDDEHLEYRMIREHNITAILED
jgi:co-chaperonin GroES (HSP10)